MFFGGNTVLYDVCSHAYPGESYAGKKDNGSLRQRTEVAASQASALLPESVHLGNLQVHLLKERIIHGSLSSYGLNTVFDHLARSITERGRSVEYRSDEGVVDISEDHVNAVDLYAVVEVVIGSAE